jgi:hypothetical protein
VLFSARCASVSVKADAISNPWMMRRPVNTAMFGIVASSSVGIDSNIRLSRMPPRRSMRRPMNAMENPAIAMPIVLAFTAKPIAAGVVP